MASIHAVNKGLLAAKPLDSSRLNPETLEMLKALLVVVASLFSLCAGGSAPAESPVLPSEAETGPPAPPTEKPKDSLTFSSAYFEKMYTNKQLAGFCLEVIRLGAHVDNLLASSPWIIIAVWRVSSMWIDFKYGTALHEAGHGLRLRATYSDGAYALMHDIKATSPTKKNENFFKFFLLELVSPGRAACHYLSEERSETHRNADLYGEKSKDFESYHKKAIISGAGGINNNVYLSELVSDRTFAQESMSSLECWSYFSNKVYGAAYAAKAKALGDDPYTVVYSYQALGIPATLSDIQRAGWISVAVSGTTYYMACASWNIFLGKEQPIRHFALWGLRVPDTCSYLTTKGVSFRTISEYNICHHLDLTFGAEYIVYGHSAREFNVGVRQTLGETWHNMSYACAFTFGLGFDAEASVRIPVSQRIALGADVGLYSEKSLLGERHSPNLRKDYGANFSVSVSWMY